MLRDNLLGLIEPMHNSAGFNPLALRIQKQVSDNRPPCLENLRPGGAESSLTENVTSPFQAEPAHFHDAQNCARRKLCAYRYDCEKQDQHSHPNKHAKLNTIVLTHGPSFYLISTRALTSCFFPSSLSRSRARLPDTKFVHGFT